MTALELTITLPDDADPVLLLGAAERNLKMIREALGVSISARGGAVKVSGEGGAVNQAAQVISELTDAARRRQPMTRSDLAQRLVRASTNGEGDAEADTGRLEVYTRQSRIEPRTAGQRRYLQAITGHDMIFCSGPAGTGKTYLAVAAAVSMLKRAQVRRLVLARPAVEAGERLGFLPGDIQQKVNPYLRPLLDAVEDMMPFEQVQRFMATDVIEVVPLAFMRGRTLNEAVIILDEAQNTTIGQMLMFLTRMGHGSKVIVTGDTSQIDLEPGVESGLVDAARRLIRVPGIVFVTLNREDIVRHSLVQRVVEAYGRQETGKM
jgi:phosphate starvation-inducible protein PhoH and related proteins